MSSRKRIIVPSSRPPAVREIQLINRVEEMDVLREAVDKAVGGQGGVVFLYGEAGIGKTRLARELGAYARSRGMQVLSGRCPALFRMDGVPPYVLWEEVIKDYLEVCTPEQLYRVIGSYPIARALGDIKSFVGGYDDSLKYWNDAFLLWTQLREKEKVSRLHRKMANVLWEEMGDAERSTERYDKALKILEAEPESVELASLYESMAHMNFRTGDMPKSLSLAKKALELAKKLNAHEVIASSYASLGTVYSSTGEKKKSIECLERALRIALDNGYVETALRAYNNLALVFWGEGEYERNLECLEKGFKREKSRTHRVDILDRVRSGDGIC